MNGFARRITGRRPAASAVNAEDPSRVDADGMFWALRDINFEIPTGEAVGIIGRNGAGKSTLLKILSRITQPTDGRIELYGRVASLLEVGTGFHPELTGRENVYLNGTILGMTRADIQQRFDDIVQFAGVEKFIDTPVKRYSSGMTVRLGFAVAAHLEPEILIVDEVLAVGDFDFQQRCLGKMDEVAGSGRTVLFVSHNMAAVRQLTSNCVLIEDGQLRFQGPTDQTLEIYLSNSTEITNGENSLETLARPDWVGDQRMKISSARIVRNQFKNESETVIEFAFNANSEGRESREDVLLGLTLHSADGTPIGAGFTPVLNASECLAVKTRVTLHRPALAPGRYWFSVAVLTERHEVLDAVQEVLHFEIPNNGHLPNGVTTWRRSWGNLQFGLTSTNRRRSLT